MYAFLLKNQLAPREIPLYEIGALSTNMTSVVEYHFRIYKIMWYVYTDNQRTKIFFCKTVELGLIKNPKLLENFLVTVQKSGRILVTKGFFN